MEVEALVMQDCPSCVKAVAQWKAVCAEQGIPVHVHDTKSERGRLLVARFDLKALPAILIDGKLKAVGVPTAEQVREILASCAGRS